MVYSLTEPTRIITIDLHMEGGCIDTVYEPEDAITIRDNDEISEEHTGFFKDVLRPLHDIEYEWDGTDYCPDCDADFPSRYADGPGIDQPFVAKMIEIIICAIQYLNKDALTYRRIDVTLHRRELGRFPSDYDDFTDDTYKFDIVYENLDETLDEVVWINNTMETFKPDYEIDFTSHRYSELAGIC